MIQPNTQGKTCPWCGETWIPRGPERPGTSCGTTCRQAANREKKSRSTPPDTRVLDEALLQEFHAIQDEVDDLLGSLDYSGAPPEDTLRILVRIQHRLDAVTPGLVERARAHGAGWNAIGAAMNLTPDSVRHKYAADLRSTKAPTRPPPDPPPRTSPNCFTAALSSTAALS